MPERMIAQGDHVRPGVQHILCLLGRQSHIGCVFSVDHRKIRLIFFPEHGQFFSQVRQSLRGHHIAHRKNICLHIFHLFYCNSSIFLLLYRFCVLITSENPGGDLFPATAYYL